MPTTVTPCTTKEHAMTVMIGVDPHKGSHTAVAADKEERSLAELRVRSGPKQLQRLLQWAERLPERTWAVENATGLGYLLAQQLVAAGERVLDVQPKLAARVRLLATESTNKNDPHDARSVAIAALRSPTPKEVNVEDHAAVMKLWARRHQNLSSTRTQIACRLHAVLCDLVAGGVPDEIYAQKAASLLARVEPDSAVAAARVELAHELLEDLRRVDNQIKESRTRLEQVVAASGTTTIDIFGVGAVVAATVVGVTGDVARFPTRDRFAAFNGTAPIEVSSGGRKIWRSPAGGTARSTTPSTWPPSPRSATGTAPGRGYYDGKIAQGKTAREALRALKRRISDALWAAMVADARRAAARTAASTKAGSGGQAGNDSVASAAGSHPDTRALRPSHSRTRPKATTTKTRSRRTTPRTPPRTRRTT
jgi:transposase